MLNGEGQGPVISEAPLEETTPLSEQLRGMFDGSSDLVGLADTFGVEHVITTVEKDEDTRFYIPPELAHLTLTHRELMRQSSELYTEAKFKVHINPALLQNMEIPTPEPDKYVRDTGERIVDPLSQERYETLCRIKADAMKVPDLDFKPGVTLMVGPNGSGKSTWAKALYLITEANRAMIWEKHEEESDLFLPPAQRLESTFSPPLGAPEATFVQLSGLAPYLARAMETDTLQARMHTEYFDHAEAVGMKVSMGHEHRLNGYHPNGNESISYDALSGSGRQTADRQISSRREEAHHAFTGKKGQPVIAFEDQPEEGADIQRQLGLVDELLAAYPEGSIIIVPTNNYLLYSNNDIPRFDTEHPERGIFTPSQYKEE